MKNIAIVTDTGSGIMQEEGRKLGISVIAMPFMINGEEYFEGLDEAHDTQGRKRLARDTFFAMQKADAEVSTSQPSITDITDVWDELLKTHDEIVHIPFSCGLSGTCQTAMMLSHEDEYEGKVFVCNNFKAAAAQRQSCLDAQKLVKEGYEGAEIQKILEREAHNCSIYATVGTLKYLKKGGRCTPAAAAVGALLRIKPVLELKDGGKLDKCVIARTERAAREAMIAALRKDLMEKHGDPTCKHGYISVLYSDDPKCSDELKAMLEAEFPGRVSKEISYDPLALNVCCHSGPGVMGVVLYEEIEELRSEARLAGAI